MADVNVVQSAREAISKMESKKAEIEKLLEKGMEKALLTIEADAKKNCPVDEGRLRASITHDTEVGDEEVKGRIGTNVEYAPYIEFGTGIYAQDGNGRQTPWSWEGEGVKWEGKHLTQGQKGKRFMQDALDSNRDKIGEIFADTLEGLK
ncbi:HK97-gp10 family putative phage morphogenesis protein [Clostridium sp. KNHs214]|uniref:HK97-gp10 family putative phage morphogenesis protein n=1 Tax=Clostridium sp. KNHs214 TaxID=1540257 RepID=UPI00054E56C8|nr:HK97-gp10 family putative phage morphogenesis protein [Clostridium sp. KNHs214]